MIRVHGISEGGRYNLYVISDRSQHGDMYSPVYSKEFMTIFSDLFCGRSAPVCCRSNVIVDQKP